MKKKPVAVMLIAAILLAGCASSAEADSLEEITADVLSTLYETKEVGSTGFYVYGYSVDSVEIQQVDNFGFMGATGDAYHYAGSLMGDNIASINGLIVDIEDPGYLDPVSFVSFYSMKFEEFAPSNDSTWHGYDSATVDFFNGTWDGYPMIVAETLVFTDSAYIRVYSSAFMLNGDFVFFEIIGREENAPLLQSLFDTNYLQQPILPNY